MKKVAIIAITICASLTLSVSSFAQKFGYVNSGELLVSMPETKTADTEMNSFQQGLVSKGEEMAAKLKADYESYMKLAQGGTLTPIQVKEKEADLNKQQQDIAAYEQEVINKVDQKRQELMGPILERLQQAIDAVGKENGYTMIFDASIPNTILFAQDGDDLGTLVKSKLGL